MRRRHRDRASRRSVRHSPWRSRPAAAADAEQRGSGSAGGAAPRSTPASTRSSTRPTRRAARSRMAHSGDWDSLDPGDTYYALLVELRPALRPHADDVQAGARATPATSSSPTWPQPWASPATTARPGPTSCARASSSRTARRHVQGRQVRRRAHLRQGHLPERPDLLQRLPRPPGLHRPVQGHDPDKLGLKAIETPDDQTIVFHLKQPFADFDYLAQIPSTAPVPQAKDTGAKYKEHVVSTGPYKFETYSSARVRAGPQHQLGRRRPTRSARRCRTRSRSASTSTPTTSTTGCWPATSTSTSRAPACRRPRRAKILADPNLKKNADSAPTAAHWFTCDQRGRRAVRQHRLPQGDRVRGRPHGYQTAYGGPRRWRHRHQPAAAADPGLRRSSTCTTSAEAAPATWTRPRRR